MPLYFLQLSTRQLEHTPSLGRICSQQCSQCNYWYLSLLCQQRLSSQSDHSSGVGSHIIPHKELSSQSRWTASRTQGYHCWSSETLSNTSRCQMNGPACLHYWSTSLCRSQVIHPSKKLSNKFLGPFEILAQHGSHSYTLQLPNSIHSVHPIFHVSMLEPAMPNKIPNWVNSLPPPIEVQGELEYEIAEFLDSKIDWWCAWKLLYYIHWLGYEGTDKEYSWLPTNELTHAPDLTSNFHSAYPNKPSPM